MRFTLKTRSGEWVLTTTKRHTPKPEAAKPEAATKRPAVTKVYWDHDGPPILFHCPLP